MQKKLLLLLILNYVITIKAMENNTFEAIDTSNYELVEKGLQCLLDKYRNHCMVANYSSNFNAYDRFSFVNQSDSLVRLNKKFIKKEAPLLLSLLGNNTFYISILEPWLYTQSILNFTQLNNSYKMNDADLLLDRDMIKVHFDNYIRLCVMNKYIHFGDSLIFNIATLCQDLKIINLDNLLKENGMSNDEKLFLNKINLTKKIFVGFLIDIITNFLNYNKNKSLYKAIIIPDNFYTFYIGQIMGKEYTKNKYFILERDIDNSVFNQAKKIILKIDPIISPTLLLAPFLINIIKNCSLFYKHLELSFIEGALHVLAFSENKIIENTDNKVLFNMIKLMISTKCIFEKNEFFGANLSKLNFQNGYYNILLNFSNQSQLEIIKYAENLFLDISNKFRNRNIEENPRLLPFHYIFDIAQNKE